MYMIEKKIIQLFIVCFESVVNKLKNTTYISVFIDATWHFSEIRYKIKLLM
jgi:hypothetical protein